MAYYDGKRKLWTEKSMEAATKGVLTDNLTIREASRVYNVPFETLRRRVNGSVTAGCKPGPATVLTEEEEDRLSLYQAFYTFPSASIFFTCTVCKPRYH